MLRALFPLLSAACQRVPLPLVPILGATEEERALLEQELAAFDAAVGPGRVEIRSVEMVDYLISRNDQISGYYQPNTGRVVISRVNPAPRDVLRHELCHAIDRAENITKKPEPLFDDLSSYIFTKTQLSESWEIQYWSAFMQRGEALAKLCEVGPVGLQALSEPCPGESAFVSQAAQWLMQNVYSEHPRSEQIDLDEIPWVTLDAWDEGYASFVSDSREPGVVLARERGESGWVRAADLYTGRIVESSPTAAFDSTTHPYLAGVHEWDVAGYAGGPAAMTGMVTLGLVQPEFLRLFVYDPADDLWRTASSCGVEGDLFTADGEVFRSLTDGELIRWQRLSP